MGSEGFGLQAKDKGFELCGLPLYEVFHYNEWAAPRALHGSNDSNVSMPNVSMPTPAPTAAPFPTVEPSSAPTAAPAPSCPKKPSFCRSKCNGSQTCTRKLSNQCERKGCVGCLCSNTPLTSAPTPAPAPSCPKKPGFCKSKCNGSQTCS